MKTLQEIKPTRHDIRYCAFRLKAGTEHKKPTPNLDLLQAVKDHFEKEFGFGGWESFAEKWDVGIDEAATAILRQDYWWCYGISRYRVVVKPPVASFVDGGEFFLAQGYATRQPDGRIMVDFAKIMKGSPERRSWFNAAMVV